MSEESFDRLLNVMPKIAEAVKDLPEDLKSRAFEELLSTFRGVPPLRTVGPGLDPRPDVTTEIEDLTSADQAPEGEDAGAGRRGRGRKAVRPTGVPKKAVAKKSWYPDRNIDFWPEDKQSFKEFVEEKQPGTLYQKNLLAVFWLEQVLEMDEIGIGQVLAAYKAMDWDEPEQPDKSLRNTASTEHWIDTSSTKSIKTTPGGRNMVKNMPIPKGKK